MNCPTHPGVKLTCPCCRSAEGGKALAKKYDKATRVKWGKRGGRPKKGEKNGNTTNSLPR